MGSSILSTRTDVVPISCSRGRRKKEGGVGPSTCAAVPVSSLFPSPHLRLSVSAAACACLCVPAYEWNLALSKLSKEVPGPVSVVSTTKSG